MAVSPPLPMSELAYNTCNNFYKTCNDIETHRNELFDKQPWAKKIAYYAVTAFAWIALIATPSCLALAAINFSLGFLILAGLSAAAVYGFGILRAKYNTFSAEEEPLLKRFQNPVGLIKNQQSIPEPTALEHKSSHFEKMVIVPKADTPSTKKDRERQFAVAKKMFEGKIAEKDLKEQIATVALTGLLLESIQNVYDKAPKDVKQIDNFGERTEALLKNSSFADNTKFADKAKIEKLIAHFKKPQKDFINNLSRKIIAENNKAVFRITDLDEALKIADQVPLPPP